MKTLIKMSHCLLVCALLVISTYSNAQEQIDLFILAGQSNAQGWKGDAAYYPEDENNLDNQIRLNSTFIRYGGNIAGWTSMGPQPGRFDDGHFGLEVAFCRQLKLEGYNPALFKFCRGATSLFADWQQPGAGGYYDDMVAALLPAIADLESQGHTVNVRGFIWIQGENDASVPEQSEAYETNLTVLINDLRNNVIHDSTMPVILGVDDVNGFDVLTTQKAIAASDPNIIFTSMLGIEKADGTHLTPAGLVVHGERVFDDYKSTFINGSGPATSNLALNGTASQSSTNFDGDASLAIDDSADGDFANGSVTHTDLEPNPWWEVDLGGEYSIGDINIFGRTGRHATRLSDFTVLVYNANGVEVHSQSFTSYPDPLETSHAGDVMGQKVRIQLNTTNYLSLAEVQVMGGAGDVVSANGVSVTPSSVSLTIDDSQQLSAAVSPSDVIDQTVSWSSSNTSVATVSPSGLVTAISAGTVIISATTNDGGFTDECSITVTIPSTGANLALNGTASQSSTAYTGDASRAIDGNTDGTWAGGSVTHTAGDASPWWEVDLGAVYSIGDIHIFGRTDACCAARLSDYTVSVINGSETTYSANLTDFPEGSVSAGGVYGQIIRVQLNATNTALSLAEVQIFEGDGPTNPTTNTFTIQENEIGFCSVDGNINNNNLDYTGDGFANTSNALGSGVNWEIDGSAGSYTITWRYASSNSRPGNLLVDGATVATNVLLNPSGSWSIWVTESITVTLGLGLKTVRLEAITASGLSNIDYMEVTGPDAAVSGCQTSARVGDKALETNTSLFHVYPNPVQGHLNIQLESGEHAKYHVLNTSGQVIQTGHIHDGTATVDLGDFNKGFYLIKVIGGSTSQIKKVIKN